MSKNQIPNHVHSYARMRNKSYFKCTHPDCPHTNSRDALEGKRAVCADCGEQFFLTRQQLYNKVPHCDACTRSPKAAQIKARRAAAADFDALELEALFSDSNDTGGHLHD